MRRRSFPQAPGISRTGGGSIKNRLFLLVFLLLLLGGCGLIGGEDTTPVPSPSPSVESPSPTPTPTPYQVKDPEGMTIGERFIPPQGFTRAEQDDTSFAAWLRALALKPDDALVYMFDGSLKADSRSDAVLRVDVGTRDLLQTTDLLIRLRSEYLFERERFSEITFHFMSGFNCSFDKWSDGFRTKVTGNKVEWVKTDEPDASRPVFDKYLVNLYVYSNATAFAQDVVASPDITIGDVFIKNGGAIVADLCQDNATGRTAVLLVRSGAPTQDAYVMSNTESPDISPWFIIPDNGVIRTPEGSFSLSDAMRFKS